MSKKKITRDLFASFGSGIDMYFSFLRKMMRVYTFVIIMMTPVLYIYYNHGGINNENASLSAKLSLGNMGLA